MYSLIHENAWRDSYHCSTQNTALYSTFPSNPLERLGKRLPERDLAHGAGKGEEQLNLANQTPDISLSYNN